MSDTPDNPKSFRLAESDTIGFEGDGERVPVAWPIRDEPPALSILHGLHELGVQIPAGATAAAVAVIESGLDRHGDGRAAEALSILLSRIGGGKRGAELRAALLGAFADETGQEAADRFGVTRQTWHTNTRRLRAKLLCQKKNV